MPTMLVDLGMVGKVTVWYLAVASSKTPSNYELHASMAEPSNYELHASMAELSSCIQCSSSAGDSARRTILRVVVNTSMEVTRS